MGLGLVLLGVASAASAQVGSSQNKAACCQLTTSLIQDMLSSKDPVGDEQLLTGGGTPPNIHFLIDTSASMRELPQVQNSNHTEFFDLTTNGCNNPRLDGYQASRGWNPNTAYPIPDPGTGLGSDTGFPDLFRDTKFYGYMYWGDSFSPPYQWDTKELACQARIPDWNGARAADYSRCLSCLSTKGYYKLPEAQAVNSGDLTNPNFILWGRLLNFNPPKHVTARAVLKQILKEVKGKRVGLSHFLTSTISSRLLRPQNPSCSQIAADPNAFDFNRGSYISAINSLSFNTGTPLARSLLNIGYYFTSGDDVYSSQFGFGTGYSYPAEYRNGALTSQSRSVCWGCQNNSVIIISDGEPSGDSLSSTVVTKLRTLNAGPVYCPDIRPCGPGPLSQRDKGLNTTSYTDDNPNYLLDDVAKLLANHDLQRHTPPVVGDFNTSGRQSMNVYTVGFGVNSNLLRNTAEVGNGLYYAADDAASLRQALLEVMDTLRTAPRSTTLAASTVESQPVGGVSAVLIPRLKPGASNNVPWQGFLYRFNSAPERALGCDPAMPGAGDLNADGDCEDTHLLDANGHAVIETDQEFVRLSSPTVPATPFWEAGARLRPAGNTTRWQTRRLYTLIDTNNDNRLDARDTPVEFSENNLWVLREYLGISDNPNECADLAARIGVASLTPNDCAKLIIRWYRGADALNPDPALREYDRPFLLHDIFHSSPVVVEAPQPRAYCGTSTQCLPALFSGATPREQYALPEQPPMDAYERYVSEKGGRDKIVLVGSNGGMLHAFHGGKQVGVDPVTGRNEYDAGTGEELWGFIPTDLLPKLRRHILKHGAFVDGTAMVREVWLDGLGGPVDGVKQWGEYRTVAVVGTGRGGVHRFALDLTRLLGAGMDYPSNVVSPNSAGDFLWMWPQPCDPLALQLGESSSHFAPQPPPVGPVALSPEADDALRMLYQQYGAPVTPWVINGQPARERWVVGLNGGADAYQSRGRGMALVDVATGHTVWSFFHGDGQGRSEFLRYPIGAGLALADVDSGESASDSLSGTDHLFDTATVGDYGGQLWTVRFWLPGQWNSATQRVSNWHAARAFRVANLAGRTSDPEALRAPITQMALNVRQPDTGVLRTFVGTGDRQNLAEVGSVCRLGNPRACAEQGCRVRTSVSVERGGAMSSVSSATYASHAYWSGEAVTSYSGASCSSARVRLDWDHDSGGTCTSNALGTFEYLCDGTSSTWSCRATVDNWAQLNLSQSTPPYPQRFYGLWSYGGNASRTFNSDAEANAFDSQLLTDSSLVDVGQFDTTGAVPTPGEAEAWAYGPGWYLQYSQGQERTSTSATVMNGCVVWSSFEPTATPGAQCSAAGGRVSRLYQAGFVSGKADCASGFTSPSTGTRYRYLRFNTQLSLPEPAPHWQSLNGQTRGSVTLSAPLGTSGINGAANSSPLISVPVSP
jgi:type IV pilus assembly protein PilY1